ncbi:sirohydrochlorin cobaltochelatase [Desulfovibrio sp. OttesenSCG-928-A18]|nr:sirohydrochlorin cobaltochelatase [Desulfovibrio sp. OttesenSCG-928-A18]
MSKSQRRKTGILLAAFGSASLSGEKALVAFAERTRRSFPDIPVRWAYTSDRMRSRLAAAGKKTDSVKKALIRMGFERYTHVAVQSLHLIPGFEYEALLEESQSARLQGGPRHISVGMPLLHTEEDVTRAVKALIAHLPGERQAGEHVLCVGHGTWHTGAASYGALARRLEAVDPAIRIGTLSGSHSVEHILSGLERTGEKRVWLLPLLSIVGKHAEEDIAGTKAESWRTRLEGEGFNCIPVLRGTVEYEGFARIWLSHLREALEKLPA